MKNKVSKEQFLAYCEIQNEGEYNMLDPAVRALGGFPKAVHHAIIKNYAILKELYAGG